MPSAKELRENLAPLRDQIYQMRDKANDPAQKWAAEDEANWAKLNNDYEVMKANAMRQERCEQLDKELSAPARVEAIPGREDFDGKNQQKRFERWTKRQKQRQSLRTMNHADQALMLQTWMRAQQGMGMRRRHQEFIERTGFNPRAKEIPFKLTPTQSRDWTAFRADARLSRGQEQRAQSINLQTAGGYTIPQGFVPDLEVALLAYANVREWCDVLRTESGNDLPWPTVNDTTNKGQILAENSQVSEVDTSFGQVVFHSFKYTTNLILVPAELLEDSAFNLAQWLGYLMGIRLGRIQANHFTFGTGAGQPMGYITAATLGVTSASQTAIAADELYTLKHSVDPWYRPGAMWTFHDQILLYVKKLKDGIGRYLWQASMAGGKPDTIDGDPIGINQSMANAVSAGNITVAYGQMSKYKVRDVNMLRMRRLVERYADYDQEGFVGFFRCDANLLDAGTHPIKYLQQHS